MLYLLQRDLLPYSVLFRSAKCTIKYWLMQTLSDTPTSTPTSHSDWPGVCRWERKQFEILLQAQFLILNTATSLTLAVHKWVRHYECLRAETVWKCAL